MQSITIEQLRQEPERYVQATQHGDIEIRAQGQPVAVLTAARNATVWQKYWNERERALSQVRLAADWDSMTAVSADRDPL
jgi:antitoxin (DNA-binding transcriptional repressor) of toxin-antitoxin stability system